MRHPTITTLTLEIYHEVTTGVQISPRKYLLDTETPAQSECWSVLLLLGNFSLLRLIQAAQGHVMELSPVFLCCHCCVRGKKQPGPAVRPAHVSTPLCGRRWGAGHLGAVKQ